MNAWIKTPDGRDFPVVDTVSFGRHPNNAIVIDDPRVSALHAAVFRAAEGYRLANLSKKNPLYLNGRPVNGVALLWDGDSIRVRDEVYLFSVDGTPRGATVPFIETTIEESRNRGAEIDYTLYPVIHEMVMLARRGKIDAMSRGAEALLRKYFGEFPPVDSKRLPDELDVWVAERLAEIKTSADGLPSVGYINRFKGRNCLSVSIQSGGSGKRVVLVLVELQPLFTEEELKEHFMREFGLTERQCELLYWLVRGRSNDAIGTIVGNTKRTVETQFHRIFPKLGVDNRFEAAMFVYRYFLKLKSAKFGFGVDGPDEPENG